MRILEIQIENVKKIRAVEIHPKGNVVEIAGRNAQGKSSILDAIATTLEGAATKIEEPVRRGSETAFSRLVLGNGEPELIVTKRWGKGGEIAKLIVERADGGILRKPQEVMNGLFAPIALDPGRFDRMSGKDRRDLLLRMVGLDLDSFDEKERGLRDKRTDVGRRLKEAQGALEMALVVDGDEEPIESISERLEELEKAREHNGRLESALEELEALDRKIEDAKNKLAVLEAGRYAKEKALGDLGQPIDVKTMAAELGELEARNDDRRRRNEGRKRRAELEAKRLEAAEEYEELSSKIVELDQEKTRSLAAAEMPIEGLSADGADVTFNGVPLSVASQSERIRIGIAIGIAARPKLPVILVRDASLFDDETMTMIFEQAEKAGALCIVERVGDGSESAWIIEDGAIARAPGGSIQEMMENDE